jgi:hypothetical protein
LCQRERQTDREHQHDAKKNGGLAHCLSSPQKSVSILGEQEVYIQDDLFVE